MPRRKRKRPTGDKPPARPSMFLLGMECAVEELKWRLAPTRGKKVLPLPAVAAWVLCHFPLSAAEKKEFLRQMGMVQVPQAQGSWILEESDRGQLTPAEPDDEF